MLVVVKPVRNCLILSNVYLLPCSQEYNEVLCDMNKPVSFGYGADNPLSAVRSFIHGLPRGLLVPHPQSDSAPCRSDKGPT